MTKVIPRTVASGSRPKVIEMIVPISERSKMMPAKGNILMTATETQKNRKYNG